VLRILKEFKGGKIFDDKNNTKESIKVLVIAM